jgi:uncharacterized membrane protein
VATFGGSRSFIFFFAAVLMIWILANLCLLQTPFDLYPFILLNLVLSTVEALQAPVITMSQNRKEEKDQSRAINDYMVNLNREFKFATCTSNWICQWSTRCKPRSKFRKRKSS